ncbi:c-type cytochrome [Azospirillum thermophilum]|uniref:Cytochrome C signal peptide protein n=1 Tax=Azospirillum thermophilum TaxID=2202148 RepID=A0A2S2CSK1_9PROT|nr:cytochrome c [Azospirillum thermophilum]AWK87267.1 cytochrome C signal peptide protein [Azospirillum thermophilum]
MSLRVVNALAAASVSALLVVGLSGAVSAADPAADPAAQVKERQQSMKKMGGGMQAISKFVKNEGATAADAAAGAEAVASVAKMDPKGIFPQGTAVGVADSAAKPELWASWGTAEQRWTAMRPAVEKLVEATRGGDRTQVAQALAATSKTCGSCHEDFRVKKN